MNEITGGKNAIVRKKKLGVEILKRRPKINVRIHQKEDREGGGERPRDSIRSRRIKPRAKLKKKGKKGKTLGVGSKGVRETSGG